MGISLKTRGRDRVYMDKKDLMLHHRLLVEQEERQSEFEKQKKKFKVKNDFNPKDPKVFAQIDELQIRGGLGIKSYPKGEYNTRFLVPCKIDIQKVIQATLKNQSQIHNDNFNFDSHGYLPIMVNSVPIGYIMNDKDSVLWFDITPEFIQIEGKWNLSALNINLPDNKESFKLEYESRWNKDEHI